MNAADTKLELLLAEDNPANVTLIRDLLEYRGFRVSVASNGIEALELAALIRPALILMDVQMPQLDGLEATRRLKQNPQLRDTPVIILTALAMEGDRERCLASGADDYLGKPIRMAELFERIDHWLQERDQASGQPADRSQRTD